MSRSIPISESLRRRLADLVAVDTQNPSGDERPVIAKLAAELRALGASAVETFSVERHHAVFAVFGPSPRILVNAHVDTVPASAGYTASPLTLVEREGRLYGLGAADTKGAIAAVLEALAERAQTGRPVNGTGILFSGDEERSNSVLRAFIQSGRGRGFERAIVCEPTRCHVGIRHRGVAAARGTTTSPGGHSSRADSLPAPMVALSRAAVALDAWGRGRRNDGPPGFEGLCLNVAGIDGGVAFNVIPPRATLTVSFRPWPGADVLALHREVEGQARAAAEPDPIAWEVILANPPFATRDLAAFAPLLGNAARGPVDLQFWTEAALLSEAGIDAVVFGPGDIAQAHAADEFVETSQLLAATDAFLQGLP
ncbi:MAG: M20/M25/M40 family metallo-hydrolase [Polyangiaceae bacterium]|jgi:acetylornithine deacetylase